MSEITSKTCRNEKRAQTKYAKMLEITEKKVKVR